MKTPGLLASLLCFLPASAADRATLFERPLILGASVSANYLAESPGLKLAKRYWTAKQQIASRARSGAKGRDQVKGLGAADLRGYSAIIGVDLFYWDGRDLAYRWSDYFEDTCAPSVQAAKRFLLAAPAAKVPTVLGNIPLGNSCAKKLNEVLAQNCRAGNRCYVLDLASILSRLQRARGLDYQGKHYALKELLPDGLHVSDVASSYLADQIDLILK